MRAGSKEILEIITDQMTVHIIQINAMLKEEDLIQAMSQVKFHIMDKTIKEIKEVILIEKEAHNRIVIVLNTMVDLINQTEGVTVQKETETITEKDDYRKKMRPNMFWRILKILN